MSCHGKAEILPEAVFQKHPIARRQRAFDVTGADADSRQPRSAFDLLHLGPKPDEAFDIGYFRDRWKTGALGNHFEPGPEARMAGLHPGLAEMSIVENDDREISRLLGGNRHQTADAHELLTVPGDDGNRSLGLCQRNAEADHGRATHRTPQIEIARMLAGGKDIVGSRSEAGYDQQVAAIGEEGPDRFAAIERGEIRGHHFVSVHFLRPIIRCEIRIATCWSLSK